jgi:hypothetical protein
VPPGQVPPLAFGGFRRRPGGRRPDPPYPFLPGQLDRCPRLPLLFPTCPRRGQSWARGRRGESHRPRHERARGGLILICPCVIARVPAGPPVKISLPRPRRPTAGQRQGHLAVVGDPGLGLGWDKPCATEGGTFWSLFAAVVRTEPPLSLAMQQTTTLVARHVQLCIFAIRALYIGLA